MQRTERTVFKFVAATLGFLSLMTNPACTASRAISAEIVFVAHAHKSELGISVDALVSMRPIETSDSLRSPSDTATER